MPRTRNMNKQDDKTTSTSSARTSGAHTAASNPYAMHHALGNQGMLAMQGSDREDKPKRRHAKVMSKVEQINGKQKRIEAAQKRRDKEREEMLDSKRRTYTPGMHGYKKKEQERLSEAFGIEVTGDTHESEHTIGFEPLNQTSGNKRGSNTTARRLENIAPAYQEVKQFHRDHIGTGTHGERDESGFNSEEYRASQRSLVEQGDVSSAVQLNQLGYAYDPNKSLLSTTDEGLAANDSYDMMVSNMESVTYASGDDEMTVDVDAQQKAEMYLARRAMITGKFPSVEEENEARRKFGLDELPTEMGSRG